MRAGVRKVRAEVKARVKVPQLGPETFCTITVLFLIVLIKLLIIFKMFYFTLIIWVCVHYAHCMSLCIQMRPTLNFPIEGLIKESIFPI